jgi:hypothetical protein
MRRPSASASAFFAVIYGHLDCWAQSHYDCDFGQLGVIAMWKVFSVNDVPWQNLSGLLGARGFEFKALSVADYSTTFNAELVRLEPGNH